MRVFVTGATGFVGSVIVQDLLANGHQVLGLSRSNEGAAVLTNAGAHVRRGELTDLDSLIAGARACDGVTHTAFIHDFSQFQRNMEIDRAAVEAMIGALEGANKSFVLSSGLAMLAPGQVVTEDVVTPPSGAAPSGRSLTEQFAIDAAARGVRTAAIRLPPSVHGAGDHGFVPRQIEAARKAGYAAYVGDGANAWATVHRTDAAILYRLALENAPPGTRLHAVAEEGVPMRLIAETIGAGLGLLARSITPEQAPAFFEFLATFVSADVRASSARTRALLDWRPKSIDLIADMRANYF